MKQERQETRKLQFLHKGMATLLLLLLSTIGAWAETVDVTSNDNGTWTNGNFTVNLSNGTTYSDNTPHSIKIKSNFFTISTNGTETITGATIYYYTKSDYSEGGNAVITTSSVESSYADRITAVSTTDNVLTVTAGTNNNIYIWKVTVSYSSGGGSKSAGDFTFTTDEGSVYVGRTLDIKTGNYTTSDDGAITFSSSDNTIATVNVSTGVVTGVAAGEATITATQAEGTNRLSSSDTYTITVNAAPTQYTVTLASSPAAGGSVSGKYNTADAYNGKAINVDFSSGDEVSENTKLTLTASPNTGYQFAGSWDGSSKTTATFTTAATTSNKTYTANFTAKTYTITLDKGTGGATEGEATATYNSSTLTSVTDATHATLTLKGYYTASSAGTKIINANGSLVENTSYTDVSGNWTHDGDVKLYAQWEAAATYSVTYHSNLDGATGTVTDASTYEAGASVPTQANSFSKSGYTFLGWSTSDGYQSSYTTAGNTVTMVAGGLDLYAQWQIDGSISSSPASGSSVVSGQAVTTTATSTAATGIKYNQGANAYNVADLIAGGGSVGSKTLNWTLSQNAIGAQIFSAVLTDGTFYSAVLTQNYTIGAAAPVISCSSNTVTITSATNNASIYYTTDGTPPTNESTLYFAPFPIGENTTVKAIAIKSGSTSATTTQVCEYGTASTALPVTFDFGASPFEVGMSFAGASGKTMSLTQNSHEVYFHGSNQTEFSIVSGSPNALRMNSNGATNHFIAIPMSGINGRIDIEIWAPYAQSSNFTIRAVLDTDHGTTVQSAAPSAIKTAALDVNDYKDGHFYFRMKDLTATEGVLYIGPASSSYKDFQKIRVTSPAHYLIPDKASVTMGDASDPETVTITNYSSYPVLLKTVPSCVTATFDPSTGVLVVTPKSVGTGNIEFAVDTDGDGIATSTDLSIPVTVTGITIGTQPVSAVYKVGGPITALSVSATNSGEGSLTYQWYKNTVNSTTGGEKVGTNSESYTPSLTAEANAFYYCEVSADGAKTKTSDVAYVLYSNTKRYFQMSNVAGNQQFSEDNLNITGQVIAGGSVTAIHGSGDYYRYITRPNTSTPHMYVTNNGSNSFRIDLDNAITDGDLISVLINGYLGSSTGIKISTNASCTENVITIDTEADTSIKTYTTAFTSGYDGKSTIYVRGINAGLSNYFTDLIISTPEDIAITGVTPTSQTVAQNATASAFTVAHTGGNGTYSYQWYTCNSDGSSESPIGGATASTYTPSTSSVGTTYYKCKVTSNAITATSSVVSCEVVASIDYYVIKTNGDTSGDAEFTTDGEYAISGSKLKTVYTDQAGASRNYWYLNNSTPGEDLSGSYYFEGTAEGTTLSMKSSGRTQHSTFYVQGAVAVKITSSSSSDRKYDVTIDGESQGTYSANSNPIFTLNKEGSVFKIDHNSGDVKISGFIFYEYLPNEVTVSKNGETVTETVIYTDESNVAFNVEGLSSGAFTATSNKTSVVTVSDSSCPEGVLTLNPVAAGTATITIEQVASGEYGNASTTLNITVKKHTLKLAFSYDKASFKASALTSGNAIPSGSLPTLTATVDGEAVDIATLGIRYQSDEPGVGRFDDDALYTVTYGGDQGGARIYAYVDNRLNPNVNSDKAYFDLVVEAGTSNALPSTAQAGSGDDKEIYEQKQFRLANSQGVEVVRLTYGGYKYAKENKWKNAEKKGDYFIDGYAYYTRHDLDAFDEYGYQIKGMKDEATDAASSAKSQYSLSTWSSQNVGNHSFWYTESEGYGRYERIRPFCLPTRGGYLKFEPKQTGKLTVYVWQNGTYSGSELGSKPRLGYWFDQDGWVQHPTTAPITKQPLSDNMGSDHISLISNMDKWTAANDDDAIKKLLINKWCSVANPNEDTPVGYFSNEATKPDEWFENPYYWLTEGEIDTNLDEDETVISKKMVPVPYHNGYMVPEASYLKYKLNVVAGKTYYFYGMMTKIGYVGMNFVEDESVFGASFGHNESLHLNATDNMATVVSSQTKDITVYDEVTLPSNYKKGQWSTICLPFALSENQVEEAFGKGTQLTIYNGARKKGTGVYSVRYLSHVDRNILAGQPYFIKPSGVDANGNDLDNVGGVIGSVVEGADEKTRITFNTVCIDKTHFSTSTNYGSNEDVNASGTDIDQYGYEFVGSTNNDKLPTYSYIVSGGKLRQFTGSNTNIPTYYAYLKPHTTEARNGSYSLTVDFNEENVETTWADDTDDDPTGVISMEAIADAMNNGKVLSGKAYNMMGQEIDPTSAKGIVIINGKKYMFK